MECFLLTDTLGVQNRKSTDNGKIATKECFLVAQTIKTLPAMQKIQVRSLGREDPLVEGMATHTSILTWRVPWTEEPGMLQSVGSLRVRYN